MIRTIFGIMWAGLSYAVTAPIFITLLFLRIFAVKKQQRAAARLEGKSYRSRFLINFSLARITIKAILIIIGLVCLFLALMRPQWGETQEIIEQEGRDLFIALDISKSMLAPDMPPSRLVFAKKKIKELVERLSCERVGLILFSGTAWIQCPLTVDYQAFFMFLDQIDVETVSSGTTSLDNAVMQALNAFKSVKDRKNKLLVIVTDGEDFSSSLSTIKQDAIAQGMHIFAMGVGTLEGAPIPIFDVYGNPQGHQKNQQGSVVISKLNEPLLQSICHDSGGTYVRAVAGSDTDVTTIVNSVSAFEKERFEDKHAPVLEERYHYFVAAAFVCFLLEWLL